MNLLLINYEYPPIGGGAATATWHIAQELNKLGHNVTVLSSCYKEFNGWKQETGVFVYRCLSVRRRQATSNIIEMLFFVISASLMLPKIVKQREIQGAIIFFLFPCGTLGLILHYLFGLPYVISLRGGDVPGTEPSLLWIHRFLTPLRHLIYKKSTSVNANSEGLKEIAQKYDPINIKVIPNGVDYKFFYPAVGKKKRHSPIRFVYAGRFSPQKNLPFMLTQLAELKRTISIPFVVHMVGTGTMQGELEKLAQQLNISDIIIWDGWIEKVQLRKIYQGSYCLLMPSLYEGMSNVILEAMACGLPVIASKVEGNIDLVEEGKTGYLFNLERPEQIQKVMRMMLENTELAIQMGENARKIVCSKYNWGKVAEQYVTYFS